MEISFRISIRVIGIDPRYNMTSIYPYGNWNYGVFRNNIKFEYKIAIIHYLNILEKQKDLDYSMF